MLKLRDRCGGPIFTRLTIGHEHKQTVTSIACQLRHGKNILIASILASALFCGYFNNFFRCEIYENNTTFTNTKNVLGSLHVHVLCMAHAPWLHRTRTFVLVLESDEKSHIYLYSSAQGASQISEASSRTFL